MSAAHRDVAIVGAGPAGSWAAYRLARGGARVTILDGSHPREKPCGGGVTRRARALVADAIDGRPLATVPIEGATFSYRGQSVRCPLQIPDNRLSPLLVTSRRDFDRTLLDGATHAGADFVPERVADVDRDGDGWIVRTRTRTVTARWVIGADGPNSLVRRRIMRPFDRHDISIASGYFVRYTTARDVAVEFVDDPPGYLWSFPRADHLAVGVCGQADEATSAALQSRAAAWISEHVGPGLTVERYSWPIPSLTEAALAAERPSGDGWLLVGDAAGLVDAITREGIYFAVRSADFAADSLLRSDDACSDYSMRLREEVYPELQRAARLKARFFRPRFTSLLVRALTRSQAIREVMADLIAGEQPYHGLRRRLFRTFEWRLMIELFGMRAA